MHCLAESFGNSKSNNQLSADSGFPCVQRGGLAVAARLLGCSTSNLSWAAFRSPETFPSKFPIFSPLFQHLSILHQHPFSFPLQPPLIAKGTCCSPGHLDVFFFFCIEKFVARSLFNSRTVFVVYLQIWYYHMQLSCFVITSTSTWNKELQWKLISLDCIWMCCKLWMGYHMLRT